MEIYELTDIDRQEIREQVHEKVKKQEIIIKILRVFCIIPVLAVAALIIESLVKNGNISADVIASVVFAVIWIVIFGVALPGILRSGMWSFIERNIVNGDEIIAYKTRIEHSYRTYMRRHAFTENIQYLDNDGALRNIEALFPCENDCMKGKNCLILCRRKNDQILRMRAFTLKLLE